MSQTGTIAAASALPAVLVARAYLRLRRRGRADLAPWTRPALAVAAGGIGAGSLLALDEAADGSLAAHMLQHVLVGDVMPLLLVLAVRGAVLPHLVPLPLLRAARALRLHRALAAATRPLPAFAFWATTLAVWHVPRLYDAALADERLHASEHLCFVVGGLLVWSVLLDPARLGLLSGWQRFGYALALLAASGALGNVLVLSYRPLYPAYGDLRDQDLAGLAMMAEQLLTVGGFAALSARRLLAGQTRPEVRRHPLAT